MSKERLSSTSAEKTASLSEAQVSMLYTRGLIGSGTWQLVLRMFRGDPSPAGPYALRTCEVAIEALVERAVDAACAAIQEKLGVKTGDLAAAVLSGGTIERELTRYVHAELAVVDGEADEAVEAGEAVEADEAVEAGAAGEAGEAGEGP